MFLFFYYLMLNQIFLGLPDQDFSHIAQALRLVGVMYIKFGENLSFVLKILSGYQILA